MNATKTTTVRPDFWRVTCALDYETRALLIALRAHEPCTITDLAEWADVDAWRVRECFKTAYSHGLVTFDDETECVATNVVGLTAVAAARRTPAEKEHRKVVIDLATQLRLALVNNGVHVATHTTGRWFEDIRLMLDVDGRDPDEAAEIIRYATTDSFWRSNILSPATLRKQYDRLRLGRQRVATAARASTVDDRAAAIRARSHHGTGSAAALADHASQAHPGERP